MEKCWIAEIIEENKYEWYVDYQFDTREEAIEEGKKLAKKEGSTRFRIGLAIPEGIPTIDGEFFIENIQNQLYDNVGEEDYLEDATKEQIDELEEQLNEVFYNWNIKHGFEPNCYNIEKEEWIEVK